jgi:hypothetical protein
MAVLVLGHVLAVFGLGQLLVVHVPMGVHEVTVPMLVLVFDVAVVVGGVAVLVGDLAVRMLVAVRCVVRVFLGCHLFFVLLGVP